MMSDNPLQAHRRKSGGSGEEYIDMDDMVRTRQSEPGNAFARLRPVRRIRVSHSAFL
jgi:hypothetical protein